VTGVVVDLAAVRRARGLATVDEQISDLDRMLAEYRLRRLRERLERFIQQREQEEASWPRSGQ
jgi:hypothetical protein